MQPDGPQSSRETPQAGGGNDVPPTGGEAREQRKETTMPLVWLGLGVVIMAAFAAILWIHFGVPHPASSPAAAPPSAVAPPAKLSH